ncbi:MAG TPA: RNA 2',3'-cyclic phosphodiesterase [Rhizomicrobium sp.]|jgi:2'-5' RNA ligase
MRLFVALAIPAQVAQNIMLIQGGVPGARWQTREQLHLTLRFIGEVDGRDAAMLDDALTGIEAPAFDLQLHSVGQFGNKQPHALWAGVRKSEALEHLQCKVDNAIRRVGQPQDAHKFAPHVTVARLRNPEAAKMIEWLTHNALFTSAEFPVTAFQLYSSRLTSDGSVYAVEQEYPLESIDGEIAD